MKKYIKLIGCIAVSGLVLMVACKKKTDAVEDAKKKIVATWRISEVVIDSNDNNVMDPQEYQTVDSAVTEIITFNEDGTGDIDNYPVKWNMIDASRFNFSFVNNIGVKDTLTAAIISPTRFDVLLPQLAPDHPSWLIYKKI